MREHAATAADTGIVEEEMDLVGAVTLGDLVAKSLDLRVVGHIGEMGRDAQSLRQPRRLAQPPGFRHPLLGDIAHRDIACLRGQLADELASHARATAADGRDPPREILHRSRLRVLYYRRSRKRESRACPWLGHGAEDKRPALDTRFRAYDEKKDVRQC